MTILGGPPPRPHYCASVREFHLGFGSAAPTEPTPMDDQTRHARARLSGSEISEVSRALAGDDLIEVLDALADVEYVTCGTIVATGYDLVHRPPHEPSDAMGPPHIPHADVTLHLTSKLYVGQAVLCEALASGDVSRVAMVAGAMLISLGKVWHAFRVPERLRDEILREVHLSNMTKLDPNGGPCVDADGRVVKGPAYAGPDILGVLREYYGRDYAPPPVRRNVATPLSGGAR